MQAQAKFDADCAAEFLRGIVDGHASVNAPPQQRLTTSTITRLWRAYDAGRAVAAEEMADESELSETTDLD